MKSRLARKLIVLTTAGVFLGCGAPAITPSPERPASYAASGRTTGSACGLEVLDLIPIGVADRAQRAYDKALAESGARALLTSSTTDSRYDLLVGTVRCTEIQGTAVY